MYLPDVFTNKYLKSGVLMSKVFSECRKNASAENENYSENFLDFHKKMGIGFWFNCFHCCFP